MMNTALAGLIGLAVLGNNNSANSPAEERLLLRQPTVSAEHVAFAYAGDLWITSREGGDARRLTVLPSIEGAPYFSPDGASIAFTGSYDGIVTHQLAQQRIGFSVVFRCPVWMYTSSSK